MSKSRFIAPAAGLLAVLLALCSLAMTVLAASSVSGSTPPFFAMRPGVAFYLIVGGIAVSLVNDGRRWAKYIGRLLAALLGFACALAIVRSNIAGDVILNGVALGFALVAISLWLRSPVAVPTATAGLVAVATILVGYLLGVPTAIFGVTTAMSGAGIVGLIALYIGVLGVHRHSGWLRWITTGRQRSTRVLLGWVIVLPVVFAFLTTQGARHGYYADDFVLAIFALATVVSLAGLVIWDARRLDQLERQRRTAAAAMRISEQRTRLATIETGIGVWDFHCDTGALFFSEEARRLFGFREDDVVDREALKARVDPAWVPAAENLLRGLLVTDGPHQAEYEFRLASQPDGDHGDRRQTDQRWMIVRASAVRNDGKVVRIVGSVLDITERKGAEARLEEARQRLELAINAADIGMWDWDLQTDSVIWSKKCFLIAGVPPADFSGQRNEFVPLIHPEDAPKSASACERALRDIEPLNVEFRIIRPDGGIRWVQNRGVLVRDDSGRPSRLIGTMVDVTATREVEAEREALLGSERAARTEADRVAKAKDDFLAMISHELRTPLNAILGWILLLRRPGVEQKLIDDGLRVIERNARAQAQLITDLFDINRLMSGKFVPELQAVNINEIVQSTLASVTPSAQEKGIELRATLAEPLDMVEGDTRRLQQIVLNLLTNAIKFTPRDGTVTVSTAVVRDAVEIAIRDTGEGMAPDLVPQLFQKFRQGDTSSSRRHGGLGLGLAITKELVELHQGVVTARSEGIGKGSEFVVRIPVLAASRIGEDSGVSKAESALLRPDSLKGLRVLAVDDQADALSYLSRVLEQQGADVEAVPAADAALAVLREPGAAFDVLISDIGMPGTNGYDFIHAVRHTLDLDEDQLPAIAVTAFARDEDQRRSLDWGYQLHITKPVHVVTLISAVRELAAARRV